MTKPEKNSNFIGQIELNKSPTMRTLYLSIAWIMIAFSIQAQTVLRFQTHGLVADHINEMKITDYADPGPQGNNVVWDFRALKLNNDFVGTLDSPTFSKGASEFTKANTLLEEFGNYFFFKSDEAGIEQHGFMSSTGTTSIIYDVPFVKMRYPFTYGSSFCGSFSGRYNQTSTQIGTLYGSYAVDGDGIGTLMLPGNMVYENALRVKEIKTYNQILNKRNYDIETITYRWYVNGHRFPILVLIKSTTIYDANREVSSTQAAYNPIALSQLKPLDVTTQNSGANFDAFPNPYHDQINIRFNLEQESNINLSVYDITGRLVTVLHKGLESAGEKNFKFSAKQMKLGAGAYIVRLIVNGEETSKRILEL